MVMLKHAHNVTGVQTIWGSIMKQIDTWEAGKYQMMAEDKSHTCKKNLSASRNKE